jgi:Fe-S cluster assembly iron-binding protein IscA
MLVLTKAATEVVKFVTSAPQATKISGLRITSSVPDPDNAGVLQVAAVAGPDEDDEVLDAAGARVFVAPQAAAFLDNKVLDAQVDGAGQPRFSLSLQPPR